MVSWDQGTNTFVDLVTSPSTEHIFTLGVQSGVYYSFKFAAVNVHGQGQASDPTVILAATIPNKMGAPVLSINQDASYKITFEAPSSGGNNVLLQAFEILLQTSEEGVFATPTECTNTLAQLYCDVALTTLQNQFSLV